jgi:hypothetical protein
MIKGPGGADVRSGGGGCGRPASAEGNRFEGQQAAAVVLVDVDPERQPGAGAR